MSTLKETLENNLNDIGALSKLIVGKEKSIKVLDEALLRDTTRVESLEWVIGR